VWIEACVNVYMMYIVNVEEESLALCGVEVLEVDFSLLSLDGGGGTTTIL
jgi:hypothetical protein